MGMERPAQGYIVATVLLCNCRHYRHHQMVLKKVVFLWLKYLVIGFSGLFYPDSVA